MSKLTYAEKLRDPRWQRKRLEVLNRDAFTCRDCGSTEKTLHVHHCFYAKGDPWQTDPRALISVCEKCHNERQELEGKIKRDLGLILAKIHDSEDDDRLWGLWREIAGTAEELGKNPAYDFGIFDRNEVCELFRKACLWDASQHKTAEK